MLPIALSPMTRRLIRLGAFAAMAVYASSQRASQPKHAEHERTLDELPDGLAAHAHRSEAERGMHAAGRFRRVLRLGPQGPAVEIDASGLGRVRVRRAG